jgi:adenylate cyclase
LAALKRHREAVFDPAVAAHSGRIVKLIGDGVIAEFGSVVDAVNCALSVQRSSATTPDQSASQPIIVLRIGSTRFSASAWLMPVRAAMTCAT